MTIPTIPKNENPRRACWEGMVRSDSEGKIEEQEGANRENLFYCHQSSSHKVQPGPPFPAVSETHSFVPRRHLAT
jgi:hypothetical protein